MHVAKSNLEAYRVIHQALVYAEGQIPVFTWEVGLATSSQTATGTGADATGRDPRFQSTAGDDFSVQLVLAKVLLDHQAGQQPTLLVALEAHR